MHDDMVVDILVYIIMKKASSILKECVDLVPAITFVFLAFIIITSCEGKHMRLDYDIQSERNMSNENNAVKINTDSIESVNKKISQSITLREHRVYYVDYSWSMISGSNRNANGTGRTLLKLVQESLKKSIREIDGEDVIIEIIPFLDAALWKENGKPDKIFRIVKNKTFDDVELAKMDAFIDDSIAPIKKPDGIHHYNTHHSVAISDFLSNRIIDNSQYHMMILLTDGVDESDKDKLPMGVSILDSKWPNSTNGKYVFGIFSNVLEYEDIPGELPKRFKEGNKQRLYYKQGLDFDFNVFIIKDIPPIDIRKDSIARVPFGGTPVEFLNRVQEDEYYRYTLEQPTDTSSYLKFYLETKKLPRPNEHTYFFKCNFKTKDNSNFFPSHHEIELTIKDEKTPNIKFWTSGQAKKHIPCVTEEIGYCKKLFGYFNPEWSDTLTLNLKYAKSSDTRYRDEFNKMKLSVGNLPVYVKLLNNKDIYLDKQSDTISISLVLDPSSKELQRDADFESYISITGADSLKAIYVNNIPLDKVTASNKISILKIKAASHCHPLLIALICLLLSLISAITIVWIIFWIHRLLSPRFSERVSIKFHLCNIKGKYSNITMAPCSAYNIGLVNLGEGTNVLLTNKFRDKFIDKIVISSRIKDVNNPMKFKFFSREWFSQKWRGDTIYVRGIYEYPINEIVIALKGTKLRTYAEITICEVSRKRNEILCLYKLSEQGEVAIAVNDSVQLVAYRNVKTSRGGNE